MFVTLLFFAIIIAIAIRKQVAVLKESAKAEAPHRCPVETDARQAPRRPAPHVRKAETPAPEVGRKPAATAERKDGRIRLRTASEARRAFVYSEIFNRKY